jgi:hypothetical protein
MGSKYDCRVLQKAEGFQQKKKLAPTAQFIFTKIVVAIIREKIGCI